jgi:hypothetical protein
VGNAGPRENRVFHLLLNVYRGTTALWVVLAMHSSSKSLRRILHAQLPALGAETALGQASLRLREMDTGAEGRQSMLLQAAWAFFQQRVYPIQPMSERRPSMSHWGFLCASL